MNAITLATRTTPSLMSAETHLLKALNVSGADERTVARATSSTVPELRTVLTKLARKLELPELDSPAKEFSQLVRSADKFLKAQPTPVSGDSVDPMQKLMEIPGWQEKLVSVAAAIAKGVLVAIDPYKIRPMPGQPRDYFPEEEQESLGDSLGMMGQVQDIIVRKKPAPASSRTTATQEFDSEDRVWSMRDTEYEICDGERRWRGVMAKGMLEIRAKLIEIDDEGAYLVAAVSNFNRVGHTALERARNIERLMKGGNAFPIEIVAIMQGITVQTAKKLLATLALPTDIHALMNPSAQRARGQAVLGLSPSYEVARLSGNPALHENARQLAGKYVRGEIKLPQLREEVDHVLSRSGSHRDVIGERNLPSRRIAKARDNVMIAIEKATHAVSLLKSLRKEGELPANHDVGFGERFNNLLDIATEGLATVRGERVVKKS